MSQNSFNEQHEWKWLFENAIDWKTINKLYYFDDGSQSDFSSDRELLDYYGEFLDQLCQWMEEKVKPRAHLLDREGAGEVKDGEMILGPLLEQTYREAKDIGFFEISAPRSHGGMGLPFSVVAQSFIHLSKACLATSCQLNFFIAMMDMLERFGDKEDCERFIPQIIAGDLSGSMCLTEPEIGSDLGNIQTTATLQEDGTYLLNGTKIFITNAGGGLALILARIKGESEGLKGLSLFLAQQHIEKNGEKIQNYRVTKNEDKLGLAGTFTCEVVYENTVAKLLGEKNKGFAHMIHLVNQSRTGVGFQCVGALEGCLEYLENYAKERHAFGTPLVELPLYKHNLNSWKAELAGIRALVVDTMSLFDIFKFLDLKQTKTGDLSEREQEIFSDVKRRIRLRTPLVKFYSSEAYVRLSAKAMQAMGSYGYMKEYQAERFHRESFGPLMYEGTSQIQSLMVLKDLLLGLAKNPMNWMSQLAADYAKGKIAKNSAQSKVKKYRFEFHSAVSYLVLSTIGQNGLQSFLKIKEAFNDKTIAALMPHAETVTEALSYVETLAILADHAQKDQSRQAHFDDYEKLIRPRMKALMLSWKI